MKHRPIVLGIAVAVVILLSFSTAAFADGLAQSPLPTPTPISPTGTICVDGYVINHRELPVDGTRTEPPLVIAAVQGANMPVLAVQPAEAVGANGYFLFDELPEGAWNFQLQLPEEWEGIVPEAEVGGLAETGLTTFAAREGCYRIVFKIRRLIDIVVVKWEEDLNGNVAKGVDWAITVTPVNDPFVKAQIANTNANGEVGFTLTPGRWIISEKVKTGWTPITPPKLALTLDQYAPTGARVPIVFKNRIPACYSTVIVQKQGFGLDAAGVAVPLGPLGGWQVTLSRADKTTAPVTLMTDAEGNATSTKVAPGVYKVKETVQPGWRVRGDNPQTLVVTTCDVYEVVFENDEIAGELSIRGRKLFKAWEEPYRGELVGLPGWGITATLVGTEIETTAVTNALGEYVFTEAQLKEAGLGFPGASIEVCEELRDNWIPVSPKCFTVKFPYPVPDTYTGAEVNFINIQDPPLGSDPSLSSADMVTNASCSAVHIVTSGETLAQIAGAYNTSMRGMVEANGIANADMIFLGQKICIP